MAKDASFDIVSEVDMQEVNNAVNQTVKEITQRYDFKGSKSTVTVEDGSVKILTEDDMRLKSIVDILESKFIRRGVAVKNLEYGKSENASGGMEADIAKKITKDVKESKLKVQTQLQDDQLRVTGKKIDDLQAVIALLKENDYGVELQFKNFRS